MENKSLRNKNDVHEMLNLHMQIHALVSKHVVLKKPLVLDTGKEYSIQILITIMCLQITQTLPPTHNMGHDM